MKLAFLVLWHAILAGGGMIAVYAMSRLVRWDLPEEHSWRWAFFAAMGMVLALCGVLVLR